MAASVGSAGRARVNRSLFTFVVDHHGGTYVSQFAGRTVSEAFEAWARGLDFGTVRGTQLQARRDRLLAYIQEFELEPVPIDGMRGVWGRSVLIGRRPLALVTIIETVRGTST